MIGILGRDVTVIKCTNPLMVGVQGTIALESMHMLTVVSTSSRKLSIPKIGTVLQLKDSGNLVVTDEMNGRLEERLAKGTRI
jgi:RNase P/RNase MRP subunit p29